MTEHAGDEGGTDAEEFIREVFAAMRGAGLEAPYAFDPQTGMFGDEERGQIDVRRLYLELGNRPKWQRDPALKKVAEYYVERPAIPQDWGYAKPRITLLFLPQIQIAEHEAERLSDPQPWAVAPITPHAAFGLGYPVSIGTLHIGVANLEPWGIDPDAAFRQAAANLAKRSGQPWMAADQYPGVYGSPWRDGFDASRLFFPAKFGAVPLRGKPVVVLPSPNRMLFADGEDERGLVNLARLARTYVEKREGTLFLRPMRMGKDGESWEDWVPPRGHPARAGLRWLQARQEAMDYAHQHAAVRLLAKGAPLTMSLPELGVVEESFGSDVLTTTVWDDQGPTALPEADRIVFRRRGEVLGSAPWERVVSKFPHLLERIPGYPPRHLGKSFPEEWLLSIVGLDPPEAPPGA